MLTGSNLDILKHIISVLSTGFPLKDLRSLHYFLGLECNRTSTRLKLSQKKYILELFKKANMLNCKPVGSPMSPSTKLSAYDSTSPLFIEVLWEACSTYCLQGQILHSLSTVCANLCMLHVYLIGKVLKEFYGI